MGNKSLKLLLKPTMVLQTINTLGYLMLTEEDYKKHIGKLVRVRAYRSDGSSIRHVGKLVKVFCGNLWVKKRKQFGKIHIDSIIKFEVLPSYYYEVMR